MKLRWNEGRPTIIVFDKLEHEIAVKTAEFLVDLYAGRGADLAEIKSILRSMKRHARAKKEEERLAKRTIH